jgi:hypothetical protein
MPARTVCRNERLLQRKNQQVTLMVRQDSTHRSICSRFRQWGTIRARSVGMDPFNNRRARSEFDRNPSADAPRHLCGESVLFRRMGCFRLARHPSSWPLAACSRASWPSTRNRSRSSFAFRWAWTACNRASRVSGSPVLAVVLDQARYRPTSRTAATQ